ncbi:MAG: hypothetical protein ACK2UB_08975, partial [Anaerolineales bacterium]
SQILLLLLGTSFPLLVFRLGRRLSGSFRVALLAGFFSIFSGFYTVYWMNTESFLIYAWIGAVYFGLSFRLANGSRPLIAFLAGGICGLAHLTRADGVVFLLPAGLLLLADRSLAWKAKGIRILWLTAGYLLIVGAWFFRNAVAWGTLLPPGAEKALWLTEYNDMFLFPSSAVGWERFFASGTTEILAARWNAILSNAVTAVFVMGLIFLFPLLVRGVFLLRCRPVMRTATVYFLLIFLLMSVAYPFQGARGGFLHSSAALLPVAAAAIAAGLEDTIERVGRRRRWNIHAAHAILGAGIILLAGIASGGVFFSRVIGGDIRRPVWSTRNAAYLMGIARLPGSLPMDTRFIVNTPSCFQLQTGFPAVPVPTGGPSMLLDAADRYGIQYIILDHNAPDGLQPLYREEESNPRLERLFSIDANGAVLIWYQVLPPPQEEHG